MESDATPPEVLFVRPFLLKKTKTGDFGRPFC